MRIYAFQLPGIPFGEKWVPLLSLIRHPFKMKMGQPFEDDENFVSIEIKNRFYIELIGRKIYIVPEKNLRDAVEIEKVLITYRTYTPKQVILYDVPLLEDRETLKVVPFKVFVEIYQMLMKEKMELPVSPTQGKMLEFIVSRKWITPQMIISLLADEDAKKILPFRAWIPISEEEIEGKEAVI